MKPFRACFVALMALVLMPTGYSAWAQTVLEQVFGKGNDPFRGTVKVPTVRDVVSDPIKVIVNPTSFINPTGIPTQGDFFEHVIKHPDATIQLLNNPGQWAYVPVANGMIAGRNAVIAGGGQPIPEEIKAFLRRWYPNDLINSVRWTDRPSLIQNVLQAGWMRFNRNTQAITLLNAIVFRNSSVTRDPALWAHELLHVQQYRQWGVYGFAQRWVDNSADGGSVEAPAYQREAEARRALTNPNVFGTSSSGSITRGSPGPGPMPRPMPAPGAGFISRCVFPNDQSAQILITASNQIVAIPPGGAPVVIGAKGPPRFPGFAWTYQTRVVTYDVTPDGRIMMPGPFGGGQQVGFVQNP